MGLTPQEQIASIDRLLSVVRREMQRIPKGQIVISWKDSQITIDVTEKGIDLSREP